MSQWVISLGQYRCSVLSAVAPISDMVGAQCPGSLRARSGHGRYGDAYPRGGATNLVLTRPQSGVDVDACLWLPAVLPAFALAIDGSLPFYR